MHRQLTPDDTVLALDIGDARIGIARANGLARIPEPLPTLKNDDQFLEKLIAIINKEGVTVLVVGLPRNLHGEETEQSRKIRQFARKFTPLGIEPIFVDESLSSKRADAYIRDQKMSRQDQDSIAASFILQEFFTTIG